MRMLTQYEQKAFKVVTLHSDMQYIHVAIQSTSFSSIGLKLEFCDLFCEMYISAASCFLHFKKIQKNLELFKILC